MTESALALTTHDYGVFGLKIRSELELPELYQDRSAGTPDVVISLGHAGAPADRDVGLHVEGNALVLVVKGIARYRITGGTSIIVEPDSDVPERNVRLFLLGSAFGALLHQRRLLPLHANAVEIDGRAFAFMGPSGAGKSTLAAWFHRQGDSVIADDVCVVGFGGDGRSFAAPGLPRLRLWAEALELMGGDTANYDRSYVGNDALTEKFDVPMGEAATARSNIELGALYLLNRGDEFSIARLGGMEAAEAVIANTYRGSYLAAVNGQENHWQSAIKLVRDKPVYRVSREWDLAKLDDQCRRLRDHATSAVSPVQP